MDATTTTPSVMGKLQTSAELAAARNWRQNLHALLGTQPALAALLSASSPGARWIYARDGALSALDDAGAWIGECSLPRRAAEAQLRKLELRGTTGCFLAPTHACQVEVALERLGARQALIVLWPDFHGLCIALACCDFSRAIEQHRLWLASGEQWPAELEAILRDHPGLPAPQQFIRTPLLNDAAAEALTRPAQQVLSAHGQRCAQLVEELRQHRPRSAQRLCVLAPSAFRLWEDAGAVLANVTATCGLETIRIDPDDPCSASGAALAIAARDCGALVAANLARADLPEVLGEQMAIITWATAPRIPPYSAAGARDILLLADSQWLEQARGEGWPAERTALATWPAEELPPVTARSAHLALIADTAPIPIEPAFDLSSHRLLWERIRQELLGDPFAAGEDVGHYLRWHMRQMEIAEAGLDWRLFTESLVLPAYAQGLAAILADAGLPLRLHGTGWNANGRFAAMAAGSIASRAELRAAAAGAAALVQAWPTPFAHPIDALGRPVIRPGARQRLGLVHDARRILAGAVRQKGTELRRLTPTLLRSILETTL